MRWLLLIVGGCAALSGGCDAAVSDPIAQIPGAQFITFRCVSSDGTVGSPLDGCGCVETLPSGERQRLPRVECTCRDVFHRNVRNVVAGPGGEPLRGTDGDWVIPSDGDTRPTQVCEPRRDGQVRAYVGSGERGNVAILDVTVDPGDSTADAKQVLDVDRTIPGLTAVFVDDLVSDIQTHPDGRFVFTINSSSGTLSVIREDTSLREDFKLDLGEGPLLRAAVWPPATRSGLSVDGPRYAFVTAPRGGVVLQLDLEALDVAKTEGTDGVVLRVLPLPAGAAPGHLALDPDGETLFVTHVRSDRITAFDVASGAGETFSLRDLSDCSDPFLVRVEPLDDDPTCADGLDNDADGLIDGDDPDCTAGSGSEAAQLGCPKLSQCVDGVDNDEDGLVDGDDPDCDPAACAGAECVVFLDWEGPVPACSDGVDNDGDGRVDRADPGCQREDDDNEVDQLELSTCANGLDDDSDGDVDGDDADCAATGGLVLPEELADGAPCANGVDDDGDGLADAEDPGCTDANAAERHNFERVSACSDGIDNDADGDVDFGADVDCYAAVDNNEAGSAVEIGPSAILSARVPTPTGPRTFLYVVDGEGNLQRIDLDDAARSARRITTGADVQAIAVRQRAYESTLLVAGADTLLRAIQITAPTVVRTPQDRPVFARLGVGVDNTFRVTSFYTVIRGTAWPVDGLEDFVGRAYDGEDLLRIERDGAVVDFEEPVEGDGRQPLSLRDPATARLDHGVLDPMVYLTEAHNTLLHEEDNLRRTASSRNNRLVTTPQVFINNSPVTGDFTTSATFCRRDPGCDPGAEPLEGCIPAGFTAAGVREGNDAIQQRNRCRMTPYEGIEVVADAPEDFPSDRFTVAFEGELPRSNSRTGQFGGRDGDDAWTLLDYDADFCGVGVEVDDVVLVDVFVPSDADAADLPECQALKDAGNFDPTRVRERLRYRVASVGQHKLELEREPRVAYAQRPRTQNSALPALFPAPAAPIFECAAQFVKYRVRVGNDQWAVAGTTSGFRHPWVAQDGQCVQDARRVDQRRIGRARLGEPFQNEWFAFTLGSPLLDDCEAGDTSAACLPPYAVDTRYEFDVAAGTGTTRMGDVILPGSMRWLPSDDRLYIVDTAQQAVIEVGGLDVYRAPLVKLRTIR